jgi:hypothetical protein
VNQPISRRAAAVAAGLAIAVGGGIAFAATRTSPADRQKELLSNAANRLNVTPDDLRSALQGAFGDQLDQAVKDGRLTQAQADAMKKRMKDTGLLPLGGGPGGHDGPGFGHRHGPGGPGGPGGPFGGLDAAAKYLGVTADELHRQLEAGTSLADVAKAKSKDVDGLVQALKDAAKAGLDKAVADKRLTRAQADSILKEVDSHVADFVNGKRPKGRFGPGRGPDRDGDGDGFGPPPPPPPPPAGTNDGTGSTAPAPSGASVS